MLDLQKEDIAFNKAQTDSNSIGRIHMTYIHIYIYIYVHYVQSELSENSYCRASDKTNQL